MAPSDCLTCPVTPSLPRPPRPAGQLTDAALPTFSFHSAETLLRKSVKMKLVPDPSDRCTTMMSALGSLAPGLAATIRRSFHLVILPRKMSAMLEIGRAHV